MRRIFLGMKLGITITLGLFFLLSMAQPVRAQNPQFIPECPNPNPLCLHNNYFVTGDYVVGGVGLRGFGDGSGFATGTINIPDNVQAQATGVANTPIPNGAFIVA